MKSKCCPCSNVCNIQFLEKEIQCEDPRYEGISVSLRTLYHKVGNIEDKVGNIEDKVGNIEDKVGNIEDKVGNIEENYCSIRQRHNGLPVYVRKDGNDGNDGLTEMTAVATIARAQEILRTLDFGYNNAQINIGEGSFDITGLRFTQVPLSNSSAFLIGAGPGKTILTAGVPSNGSYHCIEPFAFWQFNSLTLRSTSSNAHAIIVNGGVLALNNVTVESSETMSLALISVSHLGTLAINNGCFFRGNANCYIALENNSLCYNTGLLTLDGIVTTATVYVTRNSTFVVMGNIQGAVTGRRYIVDQNSVIFAKGNPEALPGTSAGQSETGGMYI